MSNEENLQSINDLIEAINARDWDRFSDKLTDPLTFVHPAFQEPQKEKAVVRKFFEQTITAMDFHFEKKCVFGNGKMYSVEFNITGTHKSPLQIPGNPPIPATNKAFELQSCWVTKIEDGKVVEWQIYVDMMSLLRQLGVKPP